MARRGFGGMNALRAALGAVTGVAEGLQQRDLLAAQRKKEEAAFDRQKQIDAQNLAMQLAGLQAQGWSAPEDLAAKRTEARGAIGSLVGSALDAASGGIPSAGPSASGLKTLQSGFATAPEPSRRISLGGREMVLRETDDERQERLAQTRSLQERTQQGEAQRLQNLLVARVSKEGLDSPAAMELAQQNPSAFNALASRANQLQQAKFEERKLGLEARRVSAAEATAAGAGGGKAGAAATGGVVLPSITEAINNFKSITPDKLRKISAAGVEGAGYGQQAGGGVGLGLSFAGGLLGVMGDDEKRYAQQAGSIADAVARASEVGVLTNFDINRFRSQILFAANDSEKLKQEKLNRALAWGEWLASNKKAIESGKLDKVKATPESIMRYQVEPRKPGESIDAYLARAGGR